MMNLIAIAKKHGSTIKTLNFSHRRRNRNECDVDARDLVTLFEHLPNLDEWDIGACNDVFRDIIGEPQPVIKKLKKLTVYGDGLTDQFLQKLLPFIASDTVEY